MTKNVTNLTSYSLNDLTTSKKAFTLAEGATHVGVFDNCRRHAFTLAEVLITLGIIGVVAAMTIPTLITNYNNKVLETQKLKMLSVLGNAFKLMMANENVTDLSLAPIANCETDSDCYANEIAKVIKGSTRIDSSDDAKTEYSFSNGNSEVWTKDKLYTFSLADGTVMSIENSNGITNGNISLVVDLNGFKTPNIGAKDLCKYVVSNNATVGEQCNAMASLPEEQSNGEDSTKTCDTGFYMSESGECVVNDVANCEIQTRPGFCDKCLRCYSNRYYGTYSVCYDNGSC